MTSHHRGRATLFGLVAALWFASLAKGAHDLWAVSVLAGWLSLLTVLFLSDCFQRNVSIDITLSSSLAAMFLALLISARFSYDTTTSRLELWIWLFSGIAFFLFINMCRDNASRFHFLKYAGLVVIPVTLVAVREYILNPPPYLFSHWAASSVFTNSAVLAGFSVSWAIVFWHFRRKDSLYYWLFASCLIALLLARSWWSVLSLAIGFTYYYKHRIKSWIVLIITFLLAIFLKLGLTPDSYKSLADRWAWWMTGLRMARQHPWVGVGLGGYAAAFPFFKSQAIFNTLYAHSFPIQLLSETGLLGTLCGVGVTYSFARAQADRRMPSKDLIAYKAALMTILTYSAATIYLDYFIGKLMLMLCAALILSSGHFQGVYLSKKSFSLTTLILLLLIPSWYLPLRASQYAVSARRYERLGDEDHAESLYRKALELNPYEEESASGLAALYRKRFERSHAVMDLSASWLWMRYRETFQ